MDDLKDYIRNSKVPVIYVCMTKYNVLVALILVLLYGDIDKTFIIMFSRDRELMKAFDQISMKLSDVGIRNVVSKLKSKFLRIIGVEGIINEIIKKQVLKQLDVRKNGFFLVNFAWTLRMVLFPANIYFRDCQKSIFIEEGVTQYVTPDENEIVLFIKRLYGNQFDFWKKSKLCKIYVHNVERFASLSNKADEFLFDEQIKCLSDKQKEYVVDFFVTKEQQKALLEVKKSAKGIVYTQPLSEDKYISESEKIRIYKDIVEYYSKYGSIVVKIHPRDLSEYGFENAMVFNRDFPSEILKVMDIDFQFAIGLCTSAVETTNARIKVNLNENFLFEKTYNKVELEI